MKLADIEAVGKLKSRREYLQGLTSYVAGDYTPKIKIDGYHDLPPEIVRKVLPVLDAEIRAEIKAVDGKLADLGVTVE